MAADILLNRVCTIGRERTLTRFRLQFLLGRNWKGGKLVKAIKLCWTAIKLTSVELISRQDFRKKPVQLFELELSELGPIESEEILTLIRCCREHQVRSQGE